MDTMSDAITTKERLLFLAESVEYLLRAVGHQGIVRTRKLKEVANLISELKREVGADD